MKKEIEKLRADFIKMYANIPLGVRNEIIAVIDKKPMSYDVCYLEIRERTKISEEILLYLKRLDLV